MFLCYNTHYLASFQSGFGKPSRSPLEKLFWGKKISEKITWGKLIWKKRFATTIMVKKDFEQIFEKIELEKAWRHPSTILETSWRHGFGMLKPHMAGHDFLGLAKTILQNDFENDLG